MASRPMAADSSSPSSSISREGLAVLLALLFLPASTFVLAVGIGDLEEHDVLLAFEDQGAFGSQHGFAVAAEAVAVDRGVLDADLLRGGEGSLAS